MMAAFLNTGRNVKLPCVLMVDKRYRKDPEIRVANRILGHGAYSKRFFDSAFVLDAKHELFLSPSRTGYTGKNADDVFVNLMPNFSFQYRHSNSANPLVRVPEGNSGTLIYCTQEYNINQVHYLSVPPEIKSSSRSLRKALRFSAENSGNI